MAYTQAALQPCDHPVTAHGHPPGQSCPPPPCLCHSCCPPIHVSRNSSCPSEGSPLTGRFFLAKRWQILISKSLFSRWLRQLNAQENLPPWGNVITGCAARRAQRHHRSTHRGWRFTPLTAGIPLGPVVGSRGQRCLQPWDCCRVWDFACFGEEQPWA